MNRFVTTACLVTALFICLFVGAVAAHAGTNAKAPEPEITYPDSPCNLANRMNIVIVDGMLWECGCARLHIGYQCDWWLIAGVDAPAAETRKIIKRTLAQHHRVTRVYLSPVTA